MPSYTSIRSIQDDAERLRVTEKLIKLRRQLDRDIPAKTAVETLLLATWNIKEFGGNRRQESMHYIAEIVSRFDLVAIQEVSPDMSGLKRLVQLLGHNWDYIVTDSTEGTAGGSERMAFVYDKCKVFFRNMAGELVLPPDLLIRGTDKAGEEVMLQFARTPFMVAFQASWFRFILTTVHILYGSAKREDPQRTAEIARLASFIKKRADKEDESYILLGDFNIFKTSDATMQALESQGFYIPDAIKQHPTDLGATKHYDQIAFRLKLDKTMTVFSEGEQRAGAFNFSETIYPPEDEPIYRPYFPAAQLAKSEEKITDYYLRTWRTIQMSDHLPLWTELRVDFSDQYLVKSGQPR